jgi:hypothetical protein
MATEFEVIAELLEDAGFKSGARRTREFEKALYRSGDAKEEVVYHQPNDFDEIRATDSIFRDAQYTQELLFDPYLEQELAPIRREFEDYDPQQEIPSPPPHSLSPQFAHTFRERFGGTATNDLLLTDLTESKNFNDTFNSKQKGALRRTITALNNRDIHTVGSLRNKSAMDLIDLRGINPRSIVFLETAFRKPQAKSS